MLIIRAAQMQVFRLERRRRFVARTWQRLRPKPQTAALDDDALTAFIEAGIDRGAAHGFVLEGHVLRFLDYLLAYGMDFGASQRTAWAGVILNTAAVSPAWKLNRIDESDLFAEPH